MPYFIGVNVTKQNSDNIFNKLCLFKYINMIKKEIFIWLKWRKSLKKHSLKSPKKNSRNDEKNKKTKENWRK